MRDVAFTVNGQTSYASSEPIDLESPSVLVESFLGSATVDVMPGQDVTVKVDWQFDGEYSNMKLETITAEGIIHIP